MSLAYDRIGDGRHTPPNIATISYLLGLIGGVGLTTALFCFFRNAPSPSLMTSRSHFWHEEAQHVSSRWPTFGFYLFLLSLFHFSEYTLQAIFHPKNIDLSAFMLDHSWEYQVAVLFGTVDTLVFPRWCGAYLPVVGRYHHVVGGVLLSGGLLCRWAAMVTAKHHFTHHIAVRKDVSHTLIQSGIYRWMRHPSYFGFTLFSAGTQLCLGNLVSFVVFVFVLHRFFADRIQYEEHLLHRFFGDEWLHYKRRVRYSGLL